MWFWSPLRILICWSFLYHMPLPKLDFFLTNMIFTIQTVCKLPQIKLINWEASGILNMISMAIKGFHCWFWFTSNKTDTYSFYKLIVTAKAYNMAFWCCPTTLLNEKLITYDILSKMLMSLLYKIALKCRAVQTRAQNSLD